MLIESQVKFRSHKTFLELLGRTAFTLSILINNFIDDNQKKAMKALQTACLL